MKRGHLLVFLYGVATLMFVQFFQRYLLNTGFDQHDLGFIVAIAFAIDLLVSVPTGALADSLGVKRISILGLALLILGAAFASFTSSWVFLVIGYLLFRVADSTVSGVINLWAKNLPETKSSGSSGLIFTRLDQMQRIGMVVMALVTGLLVQRSGFTSAIPWIVTLGITLLLMFIASKTECTTRAIGKPKSTREVYLKLKATLKANSTLKIALLSIFVLGISEGLMNSKFWAWVIEDLGFGAPVTIALIIGLQSVFRVAGQEFFVRTVKNERTRFLIALFGISAITFVFSTTLPAVILVSIWFLRIFFYSSYFPLLNKELEALSDPATISTVLSAAPMLNALGAILGGLCCSGFKMESHFTFVTMAVLCSLSAVLWMKAFSINIFGNVSSLENAQK